MSDPEYLVSHGNASDVGRFRAAGPAACRRGERVVVRSRAGLELGTVLCPATRRHAELLPDPFVGELLRPASAADESRAAGLAHQGQELFADARRLIAELGLPLDVLDVELTFDGRRAALHYLCWGACDERPLVSALSRRHAVEITLRDLAGPRPADAADHNAGCGEPGCGKAAGGGCTNCGSGGGCTNCGAVSPGELQDYFAGLRQKMDQRTPLL
jgi:cell fate regulator YaaT (PSP1 superfamily)